MPFEHCQVVDGLLRASIAESLALMSHNWIGLLWALMGGLHEMASSRVLLDGLQSGSVLLPCLGETSGDILVFAALKRMCDVGKLHSATMFRSFWSASAM